MNDNDYDEDGNNIVPCPICGDVYCPSNNFDRNGNNKNPTAKCPNEDEYVKDINTQDILDKFRKIFIDPKTGASYGGSVEANNMLAWLNAVLTHQEKKRDEEMRCFAKQVCIAVDDRLKNYLPEGLGGDIINNKIQNLT